MDRALSDFGTEIRSHILTQLVQGPHTFLSLLKESENCDPLVLRETLQDLQDSSKVHLSENDNGNRWYQLADEKRTLRLQEDEDPDKKVGTSEESRFNSSRYFRSLRESILNSLPEASPVYSQWWFSSSAYGRLIDLLKNLNKKEEPIAFIGSSTLGSLFSHFYRKTVHIFDIDSQLLQVIRNYSSKQAELIEHDILDTLDKQFKAKFEMVFVDPPWSSSSLRTFFIKSSAFVCTGGTLAISFPQRFTRPSAAIECKELLKSAPDLGLSLKRVFAGFTEYSVPLFEHIAYKKSGIYLENPWRKGDLFIFTKSTGREKNVTDSSCNSAYWQQYSRNKFRLFLKRDSLFEDGPAKIEPLSGLEDFTYYCTSSRTPAWKSASLVSSRNHAAQAYGRIRLAEDLVRIFRQRATAISTSLRYHNTPVETFLSHILHTSQEINVGEQ